MGLVAFQGDKEIRILSPSAMWGDSKKAAFRKPWRVYAQRTQLCWLPDLRRPSSRIVGNRYLLFKSPSLWYFVTAAHTKTHHEYYKKRERYNRFPKEQVSGRSRASEEEDKNTESWRSDRCPSTESVMRRQGAENNTAHCVRWEHRAGSDKSRAQMIRGPGQNAEEFLLFSEDHLILLKSFK